MSLDNYDYELLELLREAIDCGYIIEGTPAHGVALQAVDGGYASLSERQKYVYDQFVGPALKKRAKEIELERNKERMRRD